MRDLDELTTTFRRARVAFVSLDESADTGSAAGELFPNVVASISQWKRRAIGAAQPLAQIVSHGPPLADSSAA